MRERVRKTFSLLLLFVLLFSNTYGAWASSMPYVIHDKVEKTELAKGIEYENIKRFTTSGWWNLNLVRVDMTDQDTEVKTMISKDGISRRETVSGLVNQNQMLAGVNGDFFEYGPIAHPIGGLVDEGEIISSPVEHAYSWPSFIIDNEKKASVAVLDRIMKLNLPETNESIQVTMVNKAKNLKSSPDASIIYTDKWGKTTPGSKFTKATTEVVIDKGLVTEVRYGQGPVALKKDRIVLHVRGKFRPEISKIRLGQEAVFYAYTQPNFGSMKAMIGSGTQVLKNGQVIDSHKLAPGNHPRTAIGVSKDGKELIMMTVDGRHSRYNGVSQKMLGSILKSFGIHDAVSLDGGGSTAMAVKKPGSDYAGPVNYPSGGSQRKVVNGIGVKSKAKTGEFYKLDLSTSDSNVFLNSKRYFSIKALDGNLKPIDMDLSKVKLSIEGVEAQLSSNFFTPTSAGKARLVAELDGKKTYLDFRVLENPSFIEFPFDSLNMAEGEKVNIYPIYAFDGNGRKALISHTDLDFKLTDNIGSIDQGYFTAGPKTGSGIISASFGKALNNIKVSIGSEPGPVESFGSFDNMEFTAYPAYVSGGISLSDQGHNKKNSIELSYDFTAGKDTRAAYLNFKNLKLEDKPVKLGLWVKGDASGSWLRGVVTDSKGKDHTVDFSKDLNFTDWKYLEAKMPTGKDIVSLKQIYLVETNKAKSPKGSILIDKLTPSYPPKLTSPVPEASKMRDEKNKETLATESGFKFSVTSAPKDLNKLAGYDAIGKIKDSMGKANVGIFMGGIDKETSTAFDNNLIINSASPFYLGKDYKNALFLNINSDAGGIKAQNKDQWKQIKSSLANSESDHIVAVVSGKVFGKSGFKDQMEAQVFHEILMEEEAKGKTVWVVEKGSKTNVELKDGIRYIEYDGSDLKAAGDLKKIKNIEFVVNGKDISYQIKDIF